MPGGFVVSGRVSFTPFHSRQDVGGSPGRPEGVGGSPRGVLEVPRGGLGGVPVP